MWDLFLFVTDLVNISEYGAVNLIDFVQTPQDYDTVAVFQYFCVWYKYCQQIANFKDAFRILNLNAKEELFIIVETYTAPLKGLCKNTRDLLGASNQMTKHSLTIFKYC